MNKGAACESQKKAAPRSADGLRCSASEALRGAEECSAAERGHAVCVRGETVAARRASDVIDPGGVWLAPRDDRARLFLFNCGREGGTNCVNIGHWFHGVFWPAYSGALALGASSGAADLHVLHCAVPPDANTRRCTPWTTELFAAVATHHAWRVTEQQQRDGAEYCTEGALVRAPPPSPSATPAMRAALPSIRRAVLAHYGLRAREPSEPCRVVVYTRGDACTRRLLSAERLLEPLRQRACAAAGGGTVALVEEMPRSLREQAALFSNASAVVGPDGAWQNNIVFMPAHAVMVSLQPGKMDSWQVRFGTAAAISRVVAPCIPKGTKRRADPKCAGRNPEQDAHMVVDDAMVELVIASLSGKPPETPRFGTKCPR